MFIYTRIHTYIHTYTLHTHRLSQIEPNLNFTHELKKKKQFLTFSGHPINKL